MLRVHGETKNPKTETVVKMTNLTGEMGRNGLSDVEILGVVKRGYAVQSSTCVQGSPSVVADNSEDNLRTKLWREKEASSNGDGAAAMIKKKEEEAAAAEAAAAKAKAVVAVAVAKTRAAEEAVAKKREEEAAVVAAAVRRLRWKQ